ncbi:hypothetical protein ACQ4PT_029772 [Festuca glaucescens]
MPPRSSLLRRLSTHRDTNLATLLGVLRSPQASSTPLPHALSRAFPSPSDAFPLHTLPDLLPRLPSPLLSLRFLLWRLPPSPPLPSPHTLSSVAASLPDLPSAVPLLLSTSQHTLLLPHYSLLLAISAHAGLSPVSLAILRHMRSFGISPDVACFHSALRVAGSPGDVSAVLDIMSTSGVDPTVPLIVTAVHKLAYGGDFEGARCLIDKMPEFGCVANVVVYTALFDGMRAFGDVDAAMGLLEEMEGGGLGAGCVPNVVSYTCLVKCLCERGRMVEALSVLDRMVARGVMPNRVFVRTLVDGFCAAGGDGSLDSAYGVVERLVVDGALSSGQCYNVLLVALSGAGMAGEAEGLAQRMMKKGVQLSPLGGSAMVRELCRGKRWLDACYWLRLMDDDGVLCDSDVYASVLLGLSEERHILEASALVRKAMDKGICIEASCADCLVQLLKQHGEEELASHVLGLRRSPQVLSH